MAIFKKLDSPAILALKRVLIAFSWRNPIVGYCQSMNFVAAIFLLVMGEEECFWLLTTLIEEILSEDFYSKEMKDSLTFQKIFEDLLAMKIPRLYKHLTQKKVPVSLITMPWFLALFSTFQSLEYVFRFFDAIFYFGNKVLIQFSLAVFSVLEEKILAVNDGVKIVEMIKDTKSVGDELEQLVNLALSAFCDDELFQELFTRNQKLMIEDICGISSKPMLTSSNTGIIPSSPISSSPKQVRASSKFKFLKKNS